MRTGGTPILGNLHMEKNHEFMVNDGNQWKNLWKHPMVNMNPMVNTEVSINGGTTKYHNFSGIFHERNHPAIGVPPFQETPI